MAIVFVPESVHSELLTTEIETFASDLVNEWRSPRPIVGKRTIWLVNAMKMVRMIYTARRVRGRRYAYEMTKEEARFFDEFSLDTRIDIVNGWVYDEWGSAACDPADYRLLKAFQKTRNRVREIYLKEKADDE